MITAAVNAAQDAGTAEKDGTEKRPTRACV